MKLWTGEVISAEQLARAERGELTVEENCDEAMKFVRTMSGNPDKWKMDVNWNLIISALNKTRRGVKPTRKEILEYKYFMSLLEKMKNSGIQ
jgi:hypothetical protein